MRIKFWVAGGFIVLLLFYLGFAQENKNTSVGLEESKMANNDIELIKNVIEEAYIDGIHTSQDESKVRNGFHEDFIMYVKKENSVTKVGISEWLERVEVLKEKNPDLWSKETTTKSINVDVGGYAAVAKLDVYKGDTYFSTDFMLLYKLDDGWKIVSKVFAFL